MMELEELQSDDGDDGGQVTRNAGTFPKDHKWKFTVEEAVDKIGFGRFQMKLFFITGVFTASDAMEMLLLAVLSPVVRCDWKIEQWEVALITTCVFVGMFITAPVWGVLGDRFGRWPILLISAVWISYSGLLSSFSPSLPWLLFLRGCVGAGIGGAAQGFTLFSEYLPAKHRAKTMTIGNIFWATGSAFEITLAMLIIPRYGWRALAVVSAIPLAVSTVFFKFLPESARYLLASGQSKEALKVLKSAAKQNGRTLPVGRLQTTKRLKSGKMTDIFTKTYLRTTIQLWFIWFATAFSYYGVILAGSEILEFHRICKQTDANTHVAHITNTDCKCNLLTHGDYVSMIVSTFGEFTSLPINWFILDRIGRRRTIAVNLLGSAICFLLIQLCTTTTVLTMFIFGVRGFSTGVFSGIYIYTAEVYPTTVRAFALGSCSAMARLGAMSTPFVAQVLLEWSLLAAVWVYGGICLVALVVALLLPIETAGREMPQHANSGT